jgi:hypothetical protein
VVSRWPVAAFGALIVATVGAFFVVQHVKVTTPLIAGFPHPSPAYISPEGTGCGGAFRRARFSFYLLHRTDDVSVYVVDQNGNIVRTLASGRHMRKGVRNPDGDFSWNGREDSGAIAPDGKYYFRIALQNQGRTVQLNDKPITVKTVPPRPRVTGVSPSIVPSGDTPVTINYTGTQDNGGYVQLYRTDLPGYPRVLSFKTSGNGHRQWNGLINGHPAPAGTYLVGLRITDKACNTGYFPATIPPARAATPHAGLTVRYLAAQPPLSPIRAGSTTTVYVDSRQRPYGWALRLAGTKKVLEHGTVRPVSDRVSPTLRVRVPATSAGLYELAIRSGAHRALVPLVVARSNPHAAKLLVVLPALSWQGQNPVDDDGDGIPNTLSNGGPINLLRPYANGYPTGIADTASFLAYLDKSHLDYDLTTDIGLIRGAGPQLAGHRGVVLPGTVRWLPASLAASLRSYVQDGGRVLSLGIDSLRRGVNVRIVGHSATASQPTGTHATDVFGARVGSLVSHNRDFILVIKDRLGIFATTSTAFPGFSTYQPFGGVAPPAGAIASAAGTSNATPSIIGFPLGKGLVVEIGLPGFGTSLTHGNTDAQELVRRLWTVLGR